MFPKKSYTKCGGETSPRPFLKKKQNLAYLCINSQFAFIDVQIEDYQITLRRLIFAWIVFADIKILTISCGLILEVARYVMFMLSILLQKNNFFQN